VTGHGVTLHLVPATLPGIACPRGHRSLPFLQGYSVGGAVTADTVKLFLIGLPALFAGTWLGLKLYGRIDEATFRKIVLARLLVSGVVLMI
jgi:uncharacterized membrane protein YfcA